MNYLLLKPEYMDKFKCIASKCEDNCCNVNWIIFVDKKTYEKLMNVSDYEVKTLTQKYIKVIENGEDELKYAVLMKKEDGRCVFYEEGICLIHKNLGEEYLGSVCATYPRITVVITGNVEMSLKLSCPEAARVILLNPNKMEFVQEMVTKPIRMINKLLDKSKDEKYFWSLREFSIDVLQNREFSIEERLIILGVLYVNIKDNSKETMSKIPYFISQCNLHIKNGTMRDIIHNSHKDYKVKLEFLKPLLEARFKFATLNAKDFDECMDEFNKGVEKHNYEDILKKYYEPFMKEHEYIMENLLVNYAYSEIFPYLTEKSMYNEYLYMVMNFILIKHYLCGIASYNEGLNKQNVIKLIYSYFKKFESGNQSLKMLIEKAKMENKIKLDDICILLKD